MRLISKLWLLRRPTWDDLVVCIAWLFAVGLSISIMYGTTVGLGKRDVDILEQWEAPL
jgi:putative heme degradation protein